MHCVNGPEASVSSAPKSPRNANGGMRALLSASDPFDLMCHARGIQHLPQRVGPHGTHARQQAWPRVEDKRSPAIAADTSALERVGHASGNVMRFHTERLQSVPRAHGRGAQAADSRAHHNDVPLLVLSTGNGCRKPQWRESGTCRCGWNVERPRERDRLEPRGGNT
eukprot:CCRYP_018389-RD/>CCRYP_018389-RD protein AED:0.45 eAED:0.94 QI:0/0/0/1/0/0/3/0/166